MEYSREVSTGRKIWECINPLVFTFVCMLICTIVVSIVPVMQAFVESVGSMEAVTKKAAELTVVADLVFFCVILVAKFRTVITDKFKYSHQPRQWAVWKCILGAAAAFGISMGLSFLLDVIGLTRAFPEYEKISNLAFSGQNPFLLVLTIVIIGPLAEEVIFRWLIFGRIRFYFGSKWAILFSALLFGLYHMNMVQFVFCTLLGLIFAWLYDKSGCFWVHVAAHMAINFVGILGYLVQ